MSPSRQTSGGGRAKRTALVTTSDANFNDSDVVREFAIIAEPDRVAEAVLERHGATATRMTLDLPAGVAPADWAGVIATVRAGRVN